MGELNFDEIGEEKEVTVAGTLDLERIRPTFEQYRAEASRIAVESKELTVQDQDSLNRAVVLGGSAKAIAGKIEVQRKAAIAEPQEYIDSINNLAAMITDALITKKNSKKEVANPDCAESILKTKIGQHQARVEMERLERERKAREEAAALQKKLDDEVREANRKAQEEARKRAEEEMRIKREREEAEARERGAKKAELEAIAKKAEEDRQAAIKAAEAEAKKNEVVAPQVVAPVVQEAPKITRTEAGSASQRKTWTYDIFDAALVPREYLVVSDAKVRDAVKMGVRDIPGVRIYEESKTVFRS